MDKDNKRHEYVLSNNTVQALNEWLEERAASDIGRNDDHLFVSLNGNGLASETLHNIVKKYTKKALGKELSPNKLRAGFCSILYDETHDIEFVRKVVGHAKVETTQRYIATKGSEKKNAAAIMDRLLEDDDHV